MKPAKGGFLLQVLWASLGQLFQAVLAFAGLLILVRLLGPEAYGIFAIALICVGFCEILIGGHTGDGIVSVKQLRASHTNSLFWLLAILGVISGAGLLIAHDVLAQAFGVEEAGPVICGNQRASSAFGDDDRSLAASCARCAFFRAFDRHGAWRYRCDGCRHLFCALGVGCSSVSSSWNMSAEA